MNKRYPDLKDLDPQMLVRSHKQGFVIKRSLFDPKYLKPIMNIEMKILTTKKAYSNRIDVP